MAGSCANLSKNMERCTCSYDGCSRHAVCCDCLHSHLRSHELPGCCFPPEAERTYDRSIRHFIEVWGKKLNLR